MHNKHRKKLKTFAKYFYQRLSVSDILPYLLTKNVLNQHDVDEIKSTDQYESRGNAVIQLLSVLPNRDVDWYVSFIWALRASGQTDLAMLVDQEICEKMEAHTLAEVIESYTPGTLTVRSMEPK